MKEKRIDLITGEILSETGKQSFLKTKLEVLRILDNLLGDKVDYFKKAIFRKYYDKRSKKYVLLREMDG